MRKNFLAVATAALILGVAGSASAATLSDTVEITYDVAQVCSFDVGNKNLDATVENDPEYGVIQVGAMGGTMQVVCNQGTAYVIEADVAAGGYVALVGDNTAGVVPAYLLQGDITENNGIPWSTDVNGEAIHGVATGGADIQSYYVNFNTADATGMNSLPIPLADLYRGTVNVSFIH